MPTNLRKTLVKVSTLAVLASPIPFGSVRAQNLQITCNQNIDFGRLIAPGCSGKYILSPGGTRSDTAACLIINSVGNPGTCTIKVTGAAATRSALATFKAATFTATGTKGGSFQVDDPIMRLRTQPTTQASKLTIGSFTLNKGTLTLQVGATINYNSSQTEGSYTGKVAVNIDFN